MRVEFLLKTDSGYPNKVAALRLFFFLGRELGFSGGHEQTICIYVQRETRQGQAEGENCGKSRR